jgi:hypothetical protein
MRDITKSKKNSVASKCANMGGTIDRCLSKMHKKLEKLAEE